mgnify:CR=1 FL=1
MVKPKCKLTGENGNIFNLMSIASRTLKKVGFEQEANEMVDRILKSKSYDKALIWNMWKRSKQGNIAPALACTL